MCASQVNGDRERDSCKVHAFCAVDHVMVANIDCGVTDCLCFTDYLRCEKKQKDTERERENTTVQQKTINKMLHDEKHDRKYNKTNKYLTDKKQYRPTQNHHNTDTTPTQTRQNNTTTTKTNETFASKRRNF